MHNPKPTTHEVNYVHQVWGMYRLNLNIRDEDTVDREINRWLEIVANKMDSLRRGDQIKISSWKSFKTLADTLNQVNKLSRTKK